MKDEHKALIEHIISEFKKSENTIIHRSELNDMFPNIDTRGVVLNIILKNLKLIDLVVGENYNYTLTKDGYDFLSFKNYEAKELALREKEQVEFEKSKVDLELAKKVLKEFPKTKWIARIGLFIAVVLAILELIRWQGK